MRSQSSTPNVVASQPFAARSGPRAWRVLAFAVFCCSVIGCASTQYVTVRPIPKNALADTLNLLGKEGPKPTPRTEQYLRRYDLNALAESDSAALLVKMQEILQRDPDPDGCQALSEMAYIAGLKVQATDPKAAMNYFGAAVTHTYYFLFDPRFAQYRNPYDPQFRQACDLYNQSLEECLRLVHKIHKFDPDCCTTLAIGDNVWDLSVAIKNGPWSSDEFAGIEFVSDYEVSFLPNHYHTFGLGVPLIVKRKFPAQPRVEEKHLPPDLSFPMTAFLRLLPDEEGSHAHQEPHAGATCKRHRLVVELYDPLTAGDVRVCDRLVPLETDLSTPLAYFLNNPELSKLDVSTIGLLKPAETAKITGLYMLEPYDPAKIPVVFVHGLWSSPVTWLEMFNDLQGDPELRGRYQFWFYLYPTGQPFWYSATRFRSDLVEMKQRLDPQGRSAPLDQMVLVGHSMGGLVSRMQTIQSGEDLWKLVSDKSFDGLQADPETLANYRNMFFFEANSGIKRVVTLGTPLRGSEFSNGFTQWVGRKFISLPEMMLQSQAQIVTKNPGYFTNEKLLNVSTSIDSLSPKSPVFSALISARKAPWTAIHNIAGRVEQSGYYRYSSEGDGIVELSSAKAPDAVSEIIVPADHLHVHRHPLSVLEVRRILQEHAASTRTQPSPWQRRQMENPVAGRQPDAAQQPSGPAARNPRNAAWPDGARMPVTGMIPAGYTLGQQSPAGTQAQVLSPANGAAYGVANEAKSVSPNRIANGRTLESPSKAAGFVPARPHENRSGDERMHDMSDDAESAILRDVPSGLLFKNPLRKDQPPASAPTPAMPAGPGIAISDDGLPMADLPAHMPMYR